MKIVKFETTKIHGLFVKIDDFKEMKRVGMNLAGNFRIQYETVNDTTNTFTVDGIDENYKFIGLLTNLTDGQKEAVCKDADEFASLLESLKVFTVNPYGEEPESYEDWSSGKAIAFIQGTNDRIYLWQTAQEHVGNYVLLTANK